MCYLRRARRVFLPELFYFFSVSEIDCIQSAREWMNVSKCGESCDVDVPSNFLRRDKGRRDCVREECVCLWDKCEERMAQKEFNQLQIRNKIIAGSVHNKLCNKLLSHHSLRMCACVWLRVSGLLPNSLQFMCLPFRLFICERRNCVTRWWWAIRNKSFSMDCITQTFLHLVFFFSWISCVRAHATASPGHCVQSLNWWKYW